MGTVIPFQRERASAGIAADVLQRAKHNAQVLERAGIKASPSSYDELPDVVHSAEFDASFLALLFDSQCRTSVDCPDLTELVPSAPSGDTAVTVSDDVNQLDY